MAWRGSPSRLPVWPAAFRPRSAATPEPIFGWMVGRSTVNSLVVGNSDCSYRLMVCNGKAWECPPSGGFVCCGPNGLTYQDGLFVRHWDFNGSTVRIGRFVGESPE